MKTQNTKLGTSSHNGKTSFYKSESAFVYNGKAIPNWSEISEAEFYQLWDGNKPVDDLSSF